MKAKHEITGVLPPPHFINCESSSTTWFTSAYYFTIFLFSCQVNWKRFLISHFHIRWVCGYVCRSGGNYLIDTLCVNAALKNSIWGKSFQLLTVLRIRHKKEIYPRSASDRCHQITKARTPVQNHS